MMNKLPKCTIFLVLIASLIVNVGWIYYVAVRVRAVYCCRKSICEQDARDFLDMDWRFRYYKSPCLILSTHRGLSYDSCFYCVSSQVLFCSKESENSDSPFLTAKQVFVGAPNFGLSFECGQDGKSRNAMLRYNGIMIDVDTL
jgi:hypothetical protein